jgi:hypothetical protein
MLLRGWQRSTVLSFIANERRWAMLIVMGGGLEVGVSR